MINNYFEDLWKKAEKLGISKYAIGIELFGEKHYRSIYLQGKVSNYMKNRYKQIDDTINKLAGKK